MRPGVKYKTVLYCNPNLKSASPKDKKFKDNFQTACGKIPVEFLSEIPTIEKLTSIPTDEEWRAMVIIDDFMDSSFKSNVIQQLFGRMGTHNYLDSALLVQFAFSKATLFNSIYRCASAIVLFKNPSDRQMVKNINVKMFPKLTRQKSPNQFLQKALRRAQQIMGVHGYVVINCDPQNPLSESYQLSSNIFPNKKGEINATYWRYHPDWLLAQ